MAHDDRRILLPALHAARIIQMLLKAGVQVPAACGRVGRSNIVATVAHLLMRKPRAVTPRHSLPHRHARSAPSRDRRHLGVAADAGTITGSMIKPGAVVVDVGVNRIPTPPEKTFPSRRRCRCRFGKRVASLLTPVPGGVGPMTITMLLCQHA
jgi:methylenetetrahydrofolate dehydrogenase (NADP+)/methenyltetrahydrofolate cyclohydrolase